MKRTATNMTAAERLASISDPVRLRLLRLAETNELAVGEIAKVVQLPQSTVSRHLKVLADTGWLSRRPDGTATYFSLIPDDLSTDARALWTAVREPVRRSPEEAEDQHRLQGVLAERRTDSQAYFGRIAGEWDHVRQDLFGDRFTPLSLMALLRRDWVAADLGCGTGNAAELLAPFVARVIALDQSGPMLDAARRRLAGVRNVEFREAGVGATGLADRSVDVAVAMLVMHHMDDPWLLFREASRILSGKRGGGVLLMVDMVEHRRDEYRRTMGHKHPGFSRTNVLDWMARAGLREGDYLELPGEPDARGPGLFVATGRVGNT